MQRHLGAQKSAALPKKAWVENSKTRERRLFKPKERRKGQKKQRNCAFFRLTHAFLGKKKSMERGIRVIAAGPLRLPGHLSCWVQEGADNGKTRPSCRISPPVHVKQARPINSPLHAAEGVSKNSAPKKHIRTERDFALKFALEMGFRSASRTRHVNSHCSF